MKKTFIFNTQWAEILSAYTPEFRHAIYDAIIEYAITGDVPALSPMEAMAFEFIKKEMDYNSGKYKDILSKRSEAGKKGMAIRYNLHSNAAEDVTKLTNVTDNDNVNDNENVNDNDNENENVNENGAVGVDEVKPTRVGRRASPAAAAAATNRRAALFRKKVFAFQPKHELLTLQNFFDYWSEPNPSQTKMRFELERTWDLSRRLSTWAKREKAFTSRFVSYNHPATDLNNENVDTSGF